MVSESVYGIHRFLITSPSLLFFAFTINEAVFLYICSHKNDQLPILASVEAVYYMYMSLRLPLHFMRSIAAA